MTQTTIEQIREDYGSGAFHVIGPDGIRRTLDEHYDCQKDVEQDPYGAWLAIQNLSEIARMVLDLHERATAAEAERDALKAKLDEALKVLASTDNRLDALRHRPEDRTRAAIRATLAKLQGGDA